MGLHTFSDTTQSLVSLCIVRTIMHCFLTSFISLLISPLPLLLDVTCCVCIAKADNLLNNKTQYV